MDIQIVTKLPLNQAVEIFRHAMEEHSALKRMAGQGTTFETPAADPVFGQLEENRPSFEVIAHLVGNAMDRDAAVRLQAWQRDDVVHLEIASATSLLTRGAKASKFVKRFISNLQAADPQASVTEQ
jgi:hypothetical protein